MTNLQDFTNRSEVGTIKPWPKATAPAGYLLCDGSAVSRTTYADLFAITSTTYGAGDTSTTFNVPQLQGKTPQGYDGNTYNLAATGGANTVTVSVTNNQGVNSTLANNQGVSVTGNVGNTSLSTAQLSSHSHTGVAGVNSGSVGGPQQYPAGALTGSTGNNTGSSGSGTAHNHTASLTGTLTGSVALTNALTGAVTAAGTNTFSPYVVVNYIIKF